MSSLQDFAGDALLHETPDGGELAMENGLFVHDKYFSSAVYLSLFGGNKNDPGKLKNNKEWWGNTLEGISKSEKLISRFQYIIQGLPMTVKHIREAEIAAQLDLQWLIDDELADEIAVNGRAAGKNEFELEIEIKKNSSIIFEHTYSLQWELHHGSN